MQLFFGLAFSLSIILWKSSRSLHVLVVFCLFFVVVTELYSMVYYSITTYLPVEGHLDCFSFFDCYK